MDLIHQFVLTPKWKLNLSNKKPLTNNTAESANAKIKTITGTYTLKPLEVVENIMKLIDIQFIDIKKSFYNEGQFRIPKNTALKFNLTKSQLNTLFYYFAPPTTTHTKFQHTGKQRLLKQHGKNTLYT